MLAPRQGASGRWEAAIATLCGATICILIVYSASGG